MDSLIRAKDGFNDKVEHAVPGCLVGLRVEVCALSALCALCVEVCALSALCALCVEVAPYVDVGRLGSRPHRFHAPVYMLP